MMNSINSSDSINQEIPPIINNSALNKAPSPELLYEIIIENELLEVVSQTQSVIDESSNTNALNLADILQNRPSDELIVDSNVLHPDNRKDSLDTHSTITTAITAAFTAPATDEHLKAQKSEKFSESVICNENDSKFANKNKYNNILKFESGVENPFDSAFKIPTDYLPKKKRIKIKLSGKPKLPSAGTSDQWVQYHTKKASDRKVKEEKQQKRKQLLEEKKLIAEEKKKLQEKIKAIQQKIKEETK